jgi:hypothetical protein
MTESKHDSHMDKPIEARQQCFPDEQMEALLKMCGSEREGIQMSPDHGMLLGGKYSGS